MNRQQKTQEQRVRRMADRQLLRLVKAPRRSPDWYDYGTYSLRDEQDALILGDEVHGYNYTLDQVEKFLTTRRGVK